MDRLTSPYLASLPLPLALSLPFLPFAPATRTEESEKSEILSPSLSLSAARLEGSLVSALNATYRLECEAGPPDSSARGNEYL